MASFLAGFLVGAYTGAMIREEYYFPTPEKIQHAFKIYRDNEATINVASSQGTTKVEEKPKASS